MSTEDCDELVDITAVLEESGSIEVCTQAVNILGVVEIPGSIKVCPEAVAVLGKSVETGFSLADVSGDF